MELQTLIDTYTHLYDRISCQLGCRKHMHHIPKYVLFRNGICPCIYSFDKRIAYVFSTDSILIKDYRTGGSIGIIISAKDLSKDFVLGILQNLIREVSRALDQFDIHTAIQPFIWPPIDI